MSNQSPQLKILRTEQDIKLLKAYLADFDYIAFDTETTGLLKTDQVIGMSFCTEETAAYYVVLAEWDKDKGQLIDKGLYAAGQDLLRSIQGRQLIMHNSVFDCAMIEHFFKIRLIESLHTDTMVLAHLLDENRRVGLKELAKQYFGVASANEQAIMKASVIANGGSVTKDAYEMYKADSHLLGKYGAQDALLTYKLFFELVSELYDQGLDKFFYEDESMPLLRTATYDLNTKGLKVDQQALTTLKKTLEIECLETKAFIHQEIAQHIKDKYPGTTKKNGFNLGSTQQLSWLLFGKLGLEFGTLTDGGKEVAYRMMGRIPYSLADKREFIANCQATAGHEYEEAVKILTPDPTGGYKETTKRAKKIKEPWAYIAVDKKTLAKYAPKFKWVDKLLEYQRKTKLLNTYVIGFEERLLYGVLNPSFLQHGTTSGRYASRNPNFQNLPRDDKRIKACVVARPGKCFVGADYSQLEPRVFAYFSKDEQLIKAFAGDEDFYSVIGMGVYGKTDCTPHKEGSSEAFGVKYKKLRDLSKVIALATVYGGTPGQLMQTTGKSKEDTKRDMDAYLNRFPGVRKLMLDSHKQAKTDGRVVNLFGRPRRIPEAKHIDMDVSHADLAYEQRSLLNLATNHKIQSTGASIVNRAAILYYKRCKELGLNAPLVLQVHDSLVAESFIADSKQVFDILQESMETAVQLEGIRLEAVPKIGKNLAEV